MYKLKEEDIKIIKEYIDNYEIIMNKYNEYKLINESINKNIIYQKFKNIKENTNEINYERTKLITEIQNQNDEYRQNFLLNQMNTLEKDISKIEKYKKINLEEKYMEIYSGNLSIYFDKIEEEIEAPTKIYIPKSELSGKDYYYNEKTTITQIYNRIKSIYDYYKEYKNENSFFNFDKNIVFYQKFKNAIKKYNEKNKSFIHTLMTISEETIDELTQKTK